MLDSRREAGQRRGRPARIPTTCATWCPTGPTGSTGERWEAANSTRCRHYQAQIGGRRMHFLHVPPSAATPPPLPLILSHGWPSSFVEMLPLVDRLTDPGRYGGDPADAFDVVVPSLPGFLYSELPAGPLTRSAMAKTLHAIDDRRPWLPALRRIRRRHRRRGHRLAGRPVPRAGSRHPHDPPTVPGQLRLPRRCPRRAGVSRLPRRRTTRPMAATAPSWAPGRTPSPPR